MKLVISQESAQAIMNYLTGRPYIEVFQLVQSLQQLPVLAEAPVPPAPSPDAPTGADQQASN